MPSRQRGWSLPADEPARRAARVAAVGFCVAAVAGFVPGLTSHLGRIEPAGWGSGALLLGIVRVSVIGNLIHLTMAGAGLLAAQNEERSRGYLLWGGAAYTALSCHRLLVDHLVAAGQVPGQGAAGQLLPVVAGLAMVMTGLVARGVSARPTG